MNDSTAQLDSVLSLIRAVSINDGKQHIDADTHLIRSGVLDSVGVVELAAVLQSRFGVTISERDINPQTFRSARNIAQLLQSRRTV